mgnify:CR=1 FL=1|jgi:molecular chaperone Hsp33
MHDSDTLRRFLFEHYPIRGNIVHLDAAWRALLEHRDYPAPIREVLGEAVVASVLMAATLKFDGNLSLQLRGEGPMHLLLAQSTNDLGVRAVARYRGNIEKGGLIALSGSGNLTVTLETEDLSQRYQGIVPLESDSLAKCLETYFAQSEQLPTRLWLQTEENGVSGMLLQRLPAETVTAGAKGGSTRSKATAEEIEDAWRRAQLMADTLRPGELRTLTDQQILQRVFSEDDIRMFESSRVYFSCRCSRERVIGMLRALGPEELRSILAERGSVEVRCDFCNRAYQFDAVDIEHLLSDGLHAERSGAMH